MVLVWIGGSALSSLCYSLCLSCSWLYASSRTTGIAMDTVFAYWERMTQTMDVLFFVPAMYLTVQAGITGLDGLWRRCLAHSSVISVTFGVPAIYVIVHPVHCCLCDAQRTT